MNFLTVNEFAVKWGNTPRYIRMLCSSGKIKGVERRGKAYYIPEDAAMPSDRRHIRGKKVSESLVPLFSLITEKKNLLNSKRPLTDGEVARLREEFLVDYTYNSNAIEGNTLTLKETAMVLEGMTIDKKPLKDHLEAVGHRDAYLYIEEIANRKSRLKETEIKNIHSLVLMDRPEDKGVYRRIPVRILGAYTEPVEPHLIQEKVTELLSENEERKKTMHPIERIARFHLEFEGIHPFIDGNGRTGRLIMNLDLIRNGYPAVNVKFADRKRYYNAFDAFYRDNNAEEMIKLIGEYVSERLDKYNEVLKLSI